MSKRKREEEEESVYKTEQEFYEGEWENLQNELLHEDDERLTDETKFELNTIMVGGPAQDLDAATKYKFLDTIRIHKNEAHPIDNTLDELSWRVISNEKKDEIRKLLEVKREAQGGRKRKRKRKRRRRTKKKRRKRNLKKRTRRRRRKRRR